jgi:hypothetical protein
VKFPYKDVSSLPDILEMSPNNLQHLFVKGGFRRFGKDTNILNFNGPKFD